jgi:NADH dehydrogenase [ubiquinone] 1 alpha subcomplex assembly factor 7
MKGIKDHAFVSPFVEPGRVDLSVNVDFGAIKKTVDAFGVKIAEKDTTAKATVGAKTGSAIKFNGTITQGQFLTSMGIGARLMILLQSATKDQIQGLLKDAERLVKDMGQAYIVSAVTTDGDVPYPFDPALYERGQANK